jgi:3-oxoacyl-[acyl-carrier-protein] synthase III
MGTIIRKINYFLPHTVLPNSQLEKELPGWDSEKIESKTGIRERRIAADGETTLDLAYQACKLALENYDKDKIDCLILCTQSPDYFLPTSACILQDKLGLKTSTSAFDFNLGCSGFIYGLAIAKSFLVSQVASCVLLVTSETYSKHIHKFDKVNRTIFGDAAAAAIIEPSTEDHILNFVLGTDGSGYKNLIVPRGGMRMRYDPSLPEIEDSGGNIRSENNLYMNGPEIFNFTIESVPAVFNQILEKNNSRIEDIDYFIFHQANKYMLDYLRKKIKIPEDKFYFDMLLVGNTVSSTIPIALKESIENGRILKGNKIMLLGFGVGYSWGGTIIKL